MAAPESQFQTAGIQASGYTPSEYHPIGINVPSQAGELWANVGRTALSAAQQVGTMLQNSRLNPAFAAAQDYQQAQAEAAKAHIAWLQAQGRAGQMVEGTDPSGLTTQPAASLSLDPMVRLALRSAPATTPPPPAPTTGSDGSGNDGQAGQYYHDPATGNLVPVPGGQPGAAPPGHIEMGLPGTSNAPATQPKPKTQTHKDPGDVMTDGRSASTDNDFALRQMMQNRGSSAAPEGTPSSMTYTNPATGNVEPLQGAVQPTAAPPQGGNIWSPQRPSPAAPPAPDGQQQPPAQSQTPAAATQADQASMARWQAQNAHPVMSSQDALAWMKTQTTLAQDATYLPMGGPNGAPAFAFHMKGGGINTVPVSQMIQKGAGANVAAQNTSLILSKTDQAQGGDQGAMPSGTGAGAPQGSPLAQPQPQIAQQPNISPPPPANLPPPAPTGPAVAQAQPPTQYPNISPPAPPPAPGAYNAAAYQMPQGPTITQNGSVNPALMAGGSDAQAAAAAKNAAQPSVPQITDPTDFNANVRGYSQDQLDKMDKDPVLGTYGGFQWRQDRQYGTKYAVTRAESPFKELQWRAGMDQWAPVYKENGQLMEQVAAARANTPMEKVLSDTQIANMSPEDLTQALDEAVRWHSTGGDESGTTSLHIRGGINQSTSLARTIAMLEAAKKEGINPKLFNTGAQESSEEVGNREGMLPPAGQEYPAYKDPLGVEWGGPSASWDLGWAALHGMRTGRTGGQVSPLADQFKTELKYLTDQIQGTPGLPIAGESKSERSSLPISVGAHGVGVSGSVPLPSQASTLKDVNRISQGTNIDDMINGAKQLKQKVDDDIQDSVDRATRANYRTPPEFRNAVSNLKNGKNITDSENMFIDKNGNPQMPDHYKNPPGMISKVPTGGGPNTQVEDEMRRFHGNQPQTTNAPSTPTTGPTPPKEFNNVDDATKFSKNSKSGTIYRVQDSKGIWHTMRVD